MRKYSDSPAEVRFAKYLDYGFPNCIYGVSLQMSKAAREVCRGTLNTFASSLPLPGWAHVSLILPLIQRNGKWPLCCWRQWESSGETWHLLAQLLCSMLGTRYVLLPEQPLGLDGYLMCLSHHSHVLRSSGTVLTAIWEAY